MKRKSSVINCELDLKVLNHATRTLPRLPVPGFDTGFFARVGEPYFLKFFWIFSDSTTDEFSYNNFSNIDQFKYSHFVCLPVYHIH